MSYIKDTIDVSGLWVENVYLLLNPNNIRFFYTGNNITILVSEGSG